LSDAGLETLLLESRKTLKNRFALQPPKRSGEQDRFTITGSNETATFKETWEPERTSSV